MSCRVSTVSGMLWALSMGGRSGGGVEGWGRFFYLLGGWRFQIWAADLETGELIQERSFCGCSRLT